MIIGYTYEAGFHCERHARERFGSLLDAGASDREGNPVHPVYTWASSSSNVCEECFVRRVVEQQTASTVRRIAAEYLADYEVPSEVSESIVELLYEHKSIGDFVRSVVLSVLSDADPNRIVQKHKLSQPTHNSEHNSQCQNAFQTPSDDL